MDEKQLNSIQENFRYGVFINNELRFVGTEKETNDYVFSEIDKIYTRFNNNVSVLVPEKDEELQEVDTGKVYLILVELDRPIFYEILVIQQNL